ncbi:hypothetical protein CMI47_04145 [Candidatus Pacearchaeota archaeon]|nr:hypothetical protein [Candidatus Pacearchaeota archaeon]
MNNISELLNKKEKLHKDLQPYLYFEKGIGAMSLKHPLVFQLFYSPDLNAMCNNMYKQKKQCIKEYIEEKNYSQILWMYERPHRIEAFFKHIVPNLSRGSVKYWDVLRSITMDSENIWQWKENYRRLIIYVDSILTRMMMSDEELRAFKELPDKLTVYRGISESSHEDMERRNGYSWTLSRETAKFFANRFKREGESAVILVGEIDKACIKAYLQGRGEEEVIIDYSDVTLI